MFLMKTDPSNCLQIKMSLIVDYYLEKTYIINIKFMGPYKCGAK